MFGTVTVKHLREFIFENYYKQIPLTKEDCYYSLKRMKKICETLY